METGKMAGNNSSLLAGLSELEKKNILDHCIQRTVNKREVVIRQGGNGRDMFIVLSGRFKVSVLSDEGKEISFVVLYKGDYFGELSLIDGRQRSATVTAIEDGELLVLEFRAYQLLLQQHPQTAITFLTRMLLTLANRLRATDELYQDSVFLDVSARLAKFLLTANTKKPETGNGYSVVDVALSQYELGTMINASRESVNKQLKEWESRGIVDVKGSEITLRDLPLLKRKAGEA